MDLITSSDIIAELIYQKGYTSLKDFAIKNRINYSCMYVWYNENCWTKQTLRKLEKILRRNLMHLATYGTSEDNND